MPSGQGGGADACGGLCNVQLQQVKEVSGAQVLAYLQKYRYIRKACGCGVDVSGAGRLLPLAMLLVDVDVCTKAGESRLLYSQTNLLSLLGRRDVDRCNIAHCRNSAS
jgi:hypothetical protein